MRVFALLNQGSCQRISRLVLIWTLTHILIVLLRFSQVAWLVTTDGRRLLLEHIAAQVDTAVRKNTAFF